MTEYYWKRNENTGCPNAAANPSAVATSPDGDWMLAGSGTDIWISGDMGLNWLRYSSGSSKASKAACIAEDAAYMFLASDDGATGEIRRSTDQGASWSVVGNAARYVSICCSDSGRYVFAAHTAGIEVSNDYGATFSPVTTPYRGVASFDASSSDDAIQCSSATYADARSGAGTKALMGETSTLRVGQRLNAGTYYCWEAFAYWDTSSLSDALVIADAYIDIRGLSDASTTAFDIEVRSRDYGGSVQTGDYVAGADLSGLTLLATISSELVNTSYYVRSHPESALKAAINLTGNTQVLIHSSRQRTNDAPSGDEYWSLYGGTSGAKLRLRVEYLTTGGFWQICCSDDGRCVYAKQSGSAPNGEYIALSTDYGVTWSHVNPDQDNGVDLSLVYSATAGNGGICCSSDGQRLIVGPGTHVNNRQTRLSTDGGETWANSGTMVGGNYNASTQLAMSGDGTKVVATSYGGGGVAGVNWSTDGGATFTTEGYSTYTHYGASISRDGLSGCVPSNGSHNDCHVMTREVSNSALKTIWACGDAGKIYRSNDGGHSWSAQTSGTTEALKGISAYDKDNALCCGDNGIILYTHDGGATWTASADTDVTGTANDWTDVFMATPLIGWAVSHAGRIVKTTDGGVTWAIQQPDQSSKRLYCVDGTPDEVNIVMAAGPGWSGGANVLRTANGGTNWGEVACGGSYGMGCVDIHNALAVCCKQSSTSPGYKSTDSGASFASFSGNGNGAQRAVAVCSGSGWRGRHHTWKGAVAGDNRGFCSHAGLGTIGTAKLQYAGYYSLISVNLGTFYHSHAGGLGWEEPIVIAAGITLNDVWGEEEWFEWGEDLSIVVNDGAASTDDNDVHLDIHASASAQGANVPISQMCFSTDGATWSDWESYATTRAYQLPPQSDEDAHVITVYVKFRATSEGTTYTSDPVNDTISLQIDWTLVELRINGGAPATFDLDVSCRFRGTSSASSLTNHLPSSYRIRETDGAWSSWATFTPDATHRNRGWMTVPFSFAHASEHTVEVMLRDDDLNTISATASIDVIGVADSLGGAAAPVEITNWRLQLGTTIDVIDALDAPPKFNLGEHGPGSLQASIPVEHPLRKWANELTAGEDVKLWDGTLLLWDGKLKPPMPVSGEESTLIIDAAGPLDLAKQDASYLATFVDADPSHWTVSAKASKAFGCDTEGGPSIKHTKGRGVEGGKGAGIWYWVNGGKKDVAIDHLEFSDASSIDVDSSHWFARLQVATSPWGAWTTVKEWNNETLEDTAVRVPATAGQSFAEAGYADVFAVKVLLICDTDLTAAESANTRWVELADPQVFVNVEAEPSVDEALAYIANELGYADQVVEAVGTDLSSLAFLDPTTRSAAMEQVALMHPGEVEWYWRGGIFYCRPKPTAPDDRTRWYVIDSRRCEWGVVSDEARRVDYVAVTYQIKGHATIPQGTPQILYRPSTPTDPTARVGTLDMTENGPMTTSAAQDAGDQWLRWNDAQAKSGPISGFGGSLRTVDGLWVPACHARNGDWIQPLDLFDVGPLYITAVEVNGIEDVVLNIGGSEREYAYRPRVFNWPGRRGPRRPHLPPHPRRRGGRTTDG